MQLPWRRWNDSWTLRFVFLLNRVSNSFISSLINVTLANQQLKVTFHSTHVDYIHLWWAHRDILERLHVCVRNRFPSVPPVCPEATCMKVFLHGTCQGSETSGKVFASDCTVQVCTVNEAEINLPWKVHLCIVLPNRKSQYFTSLVSMIEFIYLK